MGKAMSDKEVADRYEKELADRHRMFLRCRDEVKAAWNRAYRVVHDDKMKLEEKLMFVRELIICGENLQPFPRPATFHVEPFHVRALAEWQINKLLEYEREIPEPNASLERSATAERSKGLLGT